VQLLLAILLTLTFVPSLALAEVERRFEGQWVELSGFAGIQSGGEVKNNLGQVNFDSGLSYGGMIGLRVDDDALIVVSYQRQRSNTRTMFLPALPPIPTDFDVDIGYLQIGGELELPLRPRIIPLIGLTVGATHFTPVNGDLGTSWYFSAVAYLGVKVPITKHFGLRSQISMLGTVINGDGSFLCGSGSSGSGCTINATDITGMIQGSFTAGVYLAF
jgi:hypothetical protein